MNPSCLPRGATWERALSAARFPLRDSPSAEFNVGLFEDLDDHEIFVPAQTYPPMTVQELADERAGGSGAHAFFTLRGHNPDVLSCIANLSNDEVFTPPEFANQMLDMLADAWAEAMEARHLGGLRRRRS